MTATADPRSPTTSFVASREAGAPPLPERPDRAEGIELLGAVQGSGYKEGVALARRADGQIVQLGPLMYGLLECIDGRRGLNDLAAAMSERLGRKVEDQHIRRLSEKLAQEGLLAGTEANAPPRRNPLLAMRWKVLVTNPKVTRRLTAPFAFLFHPWLMWPVMAAFVAVSWFVLIDKGVASATFQAFHNPGLLLLVFALAVVSAGFHELGHAAACRYSGATPGGMGMGIYLVWPAFYTDVTDAYRLPKRARLRIDLAGLYFNAVAAVLTMVVWLFWRRDALLLLVAVQILQMVKQLSPIIRADGYHILSDATGIPDLYSHVGPTLRRLLPGHRREPTALTGGARLLVTVWVLIVVPVLLSLMLGAILLLPHLAATAWESGRRIAALIPHQADNLQLVKLGASVLQLIALLLPVIGSALVAQKLVRSAVGKALSWSAGRASRRALVTAVGAGLIALLAWAWWPSGQYKSIRPDQGGTIPQLLKLDATPIVGARPGQPTAPPSGQVGVQLSPGSHLALAMVPVGGVSRNHPAVFILPGPKGKKPTELVSFGGSTEPRVFPFALPVPPGPGDTQALAINTKDGSVLYDVAYAVVTVSGGNPVTNTNSAYAIAQCTDCATDAVSFQVVLVVGQSNVIAPVNGAGALNYRCLSCMTTAIADQIVVTLQSQPSQALISQLEAALAQFDLLPQMGPNGTPAALAAAVGAIEQQVVTVLEQSGLLAVPPATATTVAGTAPAPTSTASATTAPQTTTTSGTTTVTGTSSSGSVSPTTTAVSSTTTGSATTASGGSTSTSPTTTATTDTTVGSTTTTAP